MYINDLFTLTHLDLFQIDVIQWFQIVYMHHIWMTLCIIYQFQAKTGNNVSEFMDSNWIMPSYYSSPKHKESVC